jgi:5-(carboxyamino)imidazole ribonucleotide synthase
VGVLCVEFFVLQDGQLLVNEMAPRPHNSGHYTIDACITSQFDQQARILGELPLGTTRQLAPAVMLNLLGDLWFDDGGPREPAFDAVAAVAGACLHVYGKTEARPGRKMGHVTVLGTSVQDALARAGEVSALLALEPAR